MLYFHTYLPTKNLTGSIANFKREMVIIRKAKKENSFCVEESIENVGFEKMTENNRFCVKLCWWYLKKKEWNRETNRQRDKYCRDWSNIDELVLGPHTKHFPQKKRNTKERKSYTQNFKT